MINNKKVLYKIKNLQEGSYTKNILKRLGERTVKVLVNNLVNDENFDLKKFFNTQKEIYELSLLEKQIHKMAENRSSGTVNGHDVDGFSAYMVSKVLNKLTYGQKRRLLSRPTNEIVAISYKLASRTEF